MATTPTYINNSITLTSTGSYQSPFTITSSEDVELLGTSVPNAAISSSLVGVSLINDGLIETIKGAAPVPGGPNYGVSFSNGGYVTNNLGATIVANETGIGIADAPGTAYQIAVKNAGEILATDYGVKLDGTAMAITNAGSIYGLNSAGIGVQGTGTIINTGTIAGHDGINFTSGGPSTVTNDGRINGTISAIDFGSAANNRLIVDPNAEFGGNVTGTGAGNVLELAGTQTGLIAGISNTTSSTASFRDFQTIALDNGAQWIMSGAYGGLNHEMLTGFSVGDTLVLDGFAATTETYVSGTGLELGNGTTGVTLDITGNFTTASFNVGTFNAYPSQFSTTTISLAPHCFATGTRILTTRGEIPVEALRVCLETFPVNSIAYAP